MKKEELIEEIKKLKKERNLCVSSGVVWNYGQLKTILEDNDKQGEIIKVEVTKGFEPGKKCYEYIIFKYPPIAN